MHISFPYCNAMVFLVCFALKLTPLGAKLIQRLDDRIECLKTATIYGRLMPPRSETLRAEMHSVLSSLCWPTTRRQNKRPSARIQQFRVGTGFDLLALHRFGSQNRNLRPPQTESTILKHLQDPQVICNPSVDTHCSTVQSDIALSL